MSKIKTIAQIDEIEDSFKNLYFPIRIFCNWTSLVNLQLTWNRTSIKIMFKIGIVLLYTYVACGEKICSKWTKSITLTNMKNYLKILCLYRNFLYWINLGYLKLTWNRISIKIIFNVDTVLVFTYVAWGEKICSKIKINKINQINENEDSFKNLFFCLIGSFYNWMYLHSVHLKLTENRITFPIITNLFT